MKTLQHYVPWPIEDRLRGVNFFLWAKNVSPLLGFTLVGLLGLFLFSGRILQIIDPAAGILDIGILSVFTMGLIGGLLSILLCLWLQELLWWPFKTFRKRFNSHFNQLTSWQQCILYFLSFFLLLYGLLWGLAMVL